MLRIHESIVVNDDREFECIKCGHKFCDSDKNYKLFSLCRERSPKELMEQYPNPKKTISGNFIALDAKFSLRLKRLLRVPRSFMTSRSIFKS